MHWSYTQSGLQLYVKRTLQLYVKSAPQLYAKRTFKLYAKRTSVIRKTDNQLFSRKSFFITVLSSLENILISWQKSQWCPNDLCPIGKHNLTDVRRMSESEATSLSNWKVRRGDEAGRQGACWEKVTFTLDFSLFWAIKGLNRHLFSSYNLSPPSY